MRPALRRAARLVRAAPMTLVLFVAVWGFGLYSGGPLHALPNDVTRQWGSGSAALTLHQWWTPFTSALLVPDLSGLLIVTTLLVVCGLAEARLGWQRILALLVPSQLLGCALAAVMVFAAHPGRFWPVDLLHSRAVGLGPGLFGVAVGVTAAMRLLWRRRIRVGVFSYLLVMLLYSGHLSDLQHLAGAVVGLAMGRLLLSRDRPLTPASPSRRETRILVTAVLLATTLGPLVASLHLRRTIPIPITAATELLVTSVPAPTAVRSVCARPGSAELCRVLRENLHSPQPAELLLAALPVLLMLVFADGLRRGRRAAWWGALVTHIGLAAVVVADLLGAADTRDLVVPATILSLPTLGVVVALWATRRAFAIRAGPGTYRRALSTVGTLLAVAVVGHYIVVTVLARDFVPVATARGAVIDFFARIAPTPLVARPALVPTSPLAAVFAAAIAPLFWLCILAILLRTFRAHQHDIVEPDDHRRARALLTRYGGGSLSYLTMWPGQRLWFDETGNCYVAYRVIRGVALTTGAPVGDPSALPGSVRGFAGHCDQHGWIPSFYCVNGELADCYEAQGWNRLHVADNALIDLTTLRFTGRRWQDVRTAIRRAAHLGVLAEWHSLAQAPPRLLEQVRLISEEWLAAKGLPEMGFTLGSVEESLDDNVRCLLAIDTADTVVAITSWMPIYRDDAVVGWTLDLMRRRADSFPGVMDFLIASAAQQFQREGSLVLSLSGTPFAFATGPAPGGAAYRLLSGASRLLEPVYGFRSLLAFKAKFQPTYEPLYLTYSDAAALPAIGQAIGRAYVPMLTWRQVARVVATVIGRMRGGYATVLRDEPAPVRPELSLTARAAPAPEGQPPTHSATQRQRVGR